MKLMKSVVAAAVAGIILSGCQTYDPYTGEKKVSKATTFGAIGAVVCGAIGSRKSSKRARNAAVGCGLLGMGIGAYMDAQEKKLRDELAGSGVQVAREGDNIRLIMPSNITFDVNQSSVRAGFYGTLDSVAKVLAEFDESILQVAGHTDSTGNDNYNYELSVKRASSVADYLASREVERKRLKVIGYGESRPIASNDSKAGQAQNRRVELLIEPQAAE